MKCNVAFTICAKNYLAQALTLRESYLEHNDSRFLIFLSDAADCPGLPDDVVELDDNWISDWKIMAFKYNVIEFSTFIKPFCIKKLFNEGYEKVVYLDPDIYVCHNLDVVFSYLEDKSIVLTPHRCKINQTDSFITSEELLLALGVFNLGFFAVKNDEVGKQVVDWWGNKLVDNCTLDITKGMFVDQKWMDFVPCYFPNETYVSPHLGMNVAIWNLHEREIFEREGSLYVKDKFGDAEYELLFFHFSGYNPNCPELLSKKIKKSSFLCFPSLKDLADKYRERELANNYERYSKMNYSFGVFSDGTTISDFIRRLYSCSIKQFVSKGDPFDSDGYFYALLCKRNLLSQCRKGDTKKWHVGGLKHNRIDYRLFYIFLKMRGVKSYLNFISILKSLSNWDYHKYLVE